MDKIFSFIIISYNRPIDTIDVVRNILFELEEFEGYEKEVIVINNDSKKSYQAFDEYLDSLEEKDRKRVIYKLSGANLGVPGGRNLGMKLASQNGAYWAFIDDDAEYIEPYVIEKTVEVFEKLEAANEKVGIITFPIKEKYLKTTDVPTKSKKLYNEKEFFTSYFKGGGHILKPFIIEEVGNYMETSLYGAEEYDLAYKTLDAGYKIFYTSEITVLHKKNPDGRANATQTARWLMENKTWLAYKYLSPQYVLTHLVLWSAYFLKHSKANIFELFKIYFSLFKKFNSTKRTPIAKATQKYIKDVGGRLTY